MTKRIKKERVATIVAGSVLFILAAIFTIAIFLRVFDYGNSSTAERSSMFNLGHMLYSAYGFCSLLIPLFFIVSGAFCFDSRWSVQRALCLIVTPLPFMTLVIAEKLIRNSATSDSAAIAFVKILLLAVVSILLIAVEYLITVILAGKLKKKMDMSKKTGVTTAPVFENKGPEENEGEEKSEGAITRFANWITEKFKSLTKKSPEITSAPSKDFAPEPESTVEIVLEEERAQAEAEDEEEEDDGSFQEPTIAENFFEDKKPLLVDSGDDEISQIPEEKEPETVGQTLAKPFKNLFKKAQDKYKALLDYFKIKYYLFDKS